MRSMTSTDNMDPLDEKKIYNDLQLASKDKGERTLDEQ